MMSSALRLRRALSFSSSLLACSTVTASSTSTTPLSPLLRIPAPSPPPTTSGSIPQIGSRGLHSTSLSLSASRSFNHGDDQIDENTILFEGCDYKHWLITMDFPKDPRPSAEEMVETYVQTLAKVVGSVEEAKRRMYACSTTTYTGFQAEIDEETAQKFEGMPGVVFVLPDSYIDPVNKEYGGDKYINGTIIPRPPPVQFGRQRRQRGPQQNPEGRSAYNRQGPMPGDGQNFMPQQNFPQQSHGPQQNYGPRQNYPSHQSHGPMQNHPPQQNHGPPQNYPPQQNYGPPRNYPPQQNYVPPQNYPPQRNYVTPQNYPPQQNYAPPRQGEGMDPMPPYNRDYSTGERNNFHIDGNPPPHHQGSYNQGDGYPLRNQTDHAQAQSYAPMSSSGGIQYGQGGLGSYGHDQNEYRTGVSYGQGANSAYGQGYAAQGENQHFAHRQGEQNIAGQREQRNYPSIGQTGTDQEHVRKPQ